MTFAKTTLMTGLTGLAMMLTCTPALAGVAQSEGTPVIRGDRAPVVPLTINTFPGDSDPYAFADFPDLPGYLPPPPSEDRGPDTEASFNPIDSGYVAYGAPKILPPNSEQVFDLPRPEWGHGFTDPTMPDTVRRLSGLDNTTRTPDGLVNVPGPGPALLIIAGAAAGRRRRR